MVSNRKAKKQTKKHMEKSKIQSDNNKSIHNKYNDQELYNKNDNDEIKISIFFDTNKIEARLSSSKCGDLYLAEVKASNDFYDIKKHIEDGGLLKYIKLCVTEISIREYKQHLIENFEEYRKGFSDSIDGYKKSFGSILDVTFEFRKNNIAEFEEHVEQMFIEFLSLNKCETIGYVKDIDFFNNLVDKAIKKQKPFVSIGGSGKKYKDAGFKDAIIGETIIRYHKKNGHKCIFITDDKDFESSFRDYPEILICKDATSTKDSLSKLLRITTLNLIKSKFESDKYIQERVISETGNTLDESVTNFDVVNINEGEENIYLIKIHSVINEVDYHFTCKYESISNEIFDVVYTTKND